MRHDGCRLTREFRRGFPKLSPARKPPIINIRRDSLRINTHCTHTHTHTHTCTLYVYKTIRYNMYPSGK